MSAADWESRMPARKGIRAMVQERADKVMSNTILAAWARLSAAFGPPIGVAIILAVAGYLITSRSDSAVQSAQQAQIAEDVKELQKYRLEATARGQVVISRLDALAKTLERMEARLDRQSAPRQ